MQITTEYRSNRLTASSGAQPESTSRSSATTRLDHGIAVADYFKLENRFNILERSHPRVVKELQDQSQADVNARRTFYEFLATRKLNPASSA